MDKVRKKRTLVLLSISILTLVIMIPALRAVALTDSTSTNPFLIMEYNPNEVYFVNSQTIIDSSNRVHFFLQIRYFNSTFVILHITEDKLIEVERGLFPGYLFQAYCIGNNVSLIYQLENQIYRHTLKFYSWNNVTGSSLSTVYTTNDVIFDPKVIFEDTILHILVTKYEYSYPEGLDITHIRIHQNGTTEEDTYFIEGIVDENEPFILNNQLFVYLKYYNYNETLEYYDSTTIIITGLTSDGYYNSTVFIINDTWFFSQISVSSDKKFYLTYVLYGTLYTFKFGINETILPENFREINFDSYYFYGVFDVFSYTNKTYIVYQDSPVYWLESIPYYYDPYQKTKTLKLHVIIDDNETLKQDSVIFDDFPNEYQFESVSYEFVENGSYSFLYSVILESSSFEDMRFISKYVFAWKASSDLDLKLRDVPILFGIRSFTPFAYFWIKYWYAVVSPLVVLMLIYVIFRKRINRGIKKMVRFLLRPIIPGAKKIELIAVNLWLFIKNASSLIFILWKANKRRLVISLIGLTILSTIIVTSTTLYDSKRESLISNYVETADLNNDGSMSLDYFFEFGNYYGIEEDPVDPNVTNYALAEILYTINTRTYVLRNIISEYYLSISTQLMSRNFSSRGDPLETQYFAIQQNYSDFMGELIIDGRLPEQKNEVVISSSFQNDRNIQLDSILSFNVSSYLGGDAIGIQNVNFTVVGVYQDPSNNLLVSLGKKYNIPSDPLNILKESIYALPAILTFENYYYNNFENVTIYHLIVDYNVQFVYDFTSINIDRLSTLLDEVNELVVESPHYFNFAPSNYWIMFNEIGWAFSGLSGQIQMTQFIVVFLSIPILYLALFLTFEVNELFSSSFEQEIRIMSSKGVSTGMIAFLYSTMKFFEAFLAVFLGLGVNLILLPPLLKLDKFITFESVLTSIKLGTAPTSMAITLLILIIISLPRIVKLSTTKKEVEKPPRKFIQLMKNIRLPYFLLIIFGAGLIALGYWLLLSSSVVVIMDPSSVLLTVYIYIIGMGVMVSLLGIGLLVRELHKILMIIISKISWLINKNQFTFSLVQVRSDIKLFNNTFLTYVILIGLLIPFIMTPLLIQDKVKTQTYFYGGSDLIVNNWQFYNDSILTDLGEYDEVVSFTNITHLEATYREYEIEFLILNDTEDFLDTAFKPPNYMFSNWNEAINNLDKNTSLLASNPFSEFVAGGEEIFNFVNDSLPEPEYIQFSIETSFDYFPVFYDYGPRESYSPYDYYYPEPNPYATFGIVMSQSNFDYISSLISIDRIALQRLLINIKDHANQEKVADKLSQDLGLEIKTMDSGRDTLLFTLFPFYSLLVSEFVFGILICFAAVAFTSLSNPLKILQRRLVKHDVLKKIGIPTNRIISLSALELFISCIIPGLILGGAAGYGLLKLFNWLFIDSMSTYGSGGLPFKIYFPYQVILIVFVAIPVVFYIIFFVAMKYNFAKYMPKNLE